MQRDPLAFTAMDRSGLCRTVLEAMSDAVLVTGPELDAPGPVIEYVNPAFTRVTGYSAEEAIGRTPRLLQGPATDRAVLDRLTADLKDHGTFSGMSTNYRKDGTTFLNEWLVTAVRDDEGQVRHWVSVQRDVTEREARDEERRLLLSELQHRVRNAMSVIAVLTGETNRRGGDLEIVRAKIDRRVSAFGQTQRLLTADPVVGVDLAELIRVQLRSVGIEAEGVPMQGPPVRIRVDAAQTLGLALHELASNAVAHGAFAGTGGRLSVSWSRAEKGVVPNQLIMIWAEEDLQGSPKRPTDDGFGLEILERTLAYSLDAKTQLFFGDDHYRCTIEVPLDRHGSFTR